MAKDSLIFLSILFIIFVIFALIGTGLFYDLEQYSHFFNSMVHLYESALGGFDFSIYENGKTSEAIGKLYMIIFLLATTILLLNFLIAIMSETYARLKNYSQGMKFAEVIKIRVIYEPDPVYSCLVRSLPLLNWIVL